MITEVICNELFYPTLKVKKFTVRFRFTPKDYQANNMVTRNQYDLVKLIHSTFKEIEIFDNNGNPLNF